MSWIHRSAQSSAAITHKTIKNIEQINQHIHSPHTHTVLMDHSNEGRKDNKLNGAIYMGASETEKVNTECCQDII
jgi:hypothetical protein